MLVKLAALAVGFLLMGQEGSRICSNTPKGRMHKCECNKTECDRMPRPETAPESPKCLNFCKPDQCQCVMRCTS